MLCDWQEDITYMIPAPSGAQRTIQPCWHEADYVVYENGIVAKGLCAFHYDGKVYRREDVSQYEPFDPAKFYGAR